MAPDGDRRDHADGSTRAATGSATSRPRSTGSQAKFSLRQTVAMALAGIDTASLGAYSAANASDPAPGRGCASGSRSISSDDWPQSRRRDSRSTLPTAAGLARRHDAGIPSRRHRRAGPAAGREVRRAGRAGPRRRPRPRIARDDRPASTRSPMPARSPGWRRDNGSLPDGSSRRAMPPPCPPPAYGGGFAIIPPPYAGES